MTEIEFFQSLENEKKPSIAYYAVSGYIIFLAHGQGVSFDKFWN